MKEELIMKSVKNYLWLTLVTMIFFVAGCNNVNEQQIDLKANEEQKEEAFNQILNDQELLNEFMNEMMSQPTSMNWMMENENFVNHMFNQDNLNYMREHNSELDNHMMNNMMYMMDRDTSVAREWNNRMHERNQMNQ
jgi:Na+-translocating ferredoxin:NAD+ oxidoreductase RnfG subunit